MKLNLIFWAQALDNSSDDYFEECNKEATDIESCNEISDKFFLAKKNGETFCKKNDFELTRNQDSILIKLNSKEKDIKGRTTSIVCLCEDAFSNVDEFCSEFQKTMKNGSGGFADRVRRSFNEESINEIFSDIKKQKEGHIKISSKTDVEPKESNHFSFKNILIQIFLFLGLSYLASKILK